MNSSFFSKRETHKEENRFFKIRGFKMKFHEILFHKDTSVDKPIRGAAIYQSY